MYLKLREDIFPVIYDVNNLYLSGNTGWKISSNPNSTNLCFNYNSSNKTYIDTNGDLYLNGNLYYSGSTSFITTLNSFVTNSSLSSTLSSYITNTSLTSSLSNYASLNNPVFGGSNLFFLTTSNGG